MLITGYVKPTEPAGTVADLVAAKRRAIFEQHEARMRKYPVQTALACRFALLVASECPSLTVEGPDYAHQGREYAYALRHNGERVLWVALSIYTDAKPNQEDAEDLLELKALDGLWRWCVVLPTKITAHALIEFDNRVREGLADWIVLHS